MTSGFLFRVRANALPTFVNFNVSFGCAKGKQTLSTPSTDKGIAAK